MAETLTIFKNANQSQIEIASNQLSSMLQSGQLQNEDFVLVDNDWVGIAEYLASAEQGQQSPPVLSLATSASPASSASASTNSASKKEYLVTFVTTGIFSGTLKPEKLQEALNVPARQGWTFVRSIHETKRVLMIFRREAHFLIFSRDIG